MTAHGFALFDTAIGRCGIAWSDRGVAGIQLPEGREDATRARLARRFPDAREASPPGDVGRAVDDIASLLRGETSDLAAIALDMDGVPDFHRRVYDVARAVPPGSTISYGEIAKRIGEPNSARAVGAALGKNPFALIVPCHRVLAAGGRAGGFSANGGVATKLRILSIEGATTNETLPLFEGDGAFGFDPDAALAHLRTADATLGKLIDDVGAFRMTLKRAPSLFAALAESIVYQQLHGKAAATIFGRVCALFPRAHTGFTAEQLLRVSEESLRGAGLSQAKMLSLRDLAQRAKRGEIPTLAEASAMSDDEIVNRLVEVRGVGRWTAEMLLIFRLGRPDVLPVDDYGVRKGFAVAFRKRDMPEREALAKYGARWKPYRTVASWYLWRASERAAAPKGE